MPRGGRRPGAGARKGNTNALKGGANSARLRQLALALNFHPHKVQLYRVGLELGALPRNPRNLDLAKVVRVLYPAVFDPTHPRYNDIANPSCTELEAKIAAQAIVKGGRTLTVLADNHQRPSNTVNDSQTPEASLALENQPVDSDKTQTAKNESPSNNAPGDRQADLEGTTND